MKEYYLRQLRQKVVDETFADFNLIEFEGDYTRAIELYPDFANAYLNRSALRYALHNPKAAVSCCVSNSPLR